MSNLHDHISEERQATARIADLAEIDRQRAEARNNPAFVQIQKSIMPAIALLARKHPAAFQIMWTFADKSDRQNAVCVTQQALAKLLNMHIQSVKTAIKHLAENNWIEVIKIGKTNAYNLNSRVAWKTDVTGRWAVFHATIIADEEDQDELNRRKRGETLKNMPILGHRETAVLAGPDNDQKDLALD